MDTRIIAFNQKFKSAQNYLDCQEIQQIVSIKYRGMGNYSDYRTFINDTLEKQLNLKTEKVVGDFQGTSWKITDQENNSVLIVEHETGLEILYVAGSIASLIALIPLINTGWRYLKHRFFDRPFPPDDNSGVEIRTIDKKNRLVA